MSSLDLCYTGGTIICVDNAAAVHSVVQLYFVLFKKRLNNFSEVRGK